MPVASWIRFRVPAFALALAFLPLPAAAQLTPAVERAMDSITPEDMARRIGILAHDSMRGRNTPSPELEAAARWIGSEFQRMGLAPGGDGGSYAQRFAILETATDVAASSLSVGNVTLRFGTDVVAPQGLSSDLDLTGEVVLLRGSEGFTERLGSLPLAGKHVILVSQGGGLGAAATPVRQMTTGLRRAGVLSILVAGDRPNRDWRAEVERQADQIRMELPWAGEPEGQAPLLEVRDEALERILTGSGVGLAQARRAFSGAFEMVPLGGRRGTLTARRRVVSDNSAPNVVGILEGSDPVLKNEYVVYSAHMDHVGVGRPDASGDSIYNGADDNASGTTTIMEVAEAFAMLQPRPRRSIIFVAVSGEEKGLWGSDYFAGHPPVPLGQLVANFNLDMVGRNWSDTIVAIGKEHSDLGETMNRVNDRHPELGMTAIDDLWPEQNFYFRSDHYHFARRGVPVLFFFNGVHPEYHRPADHVELIDVEKMARIGRLTFLLGLEVANADQRPKWNPESYARIATDAPGN